MAKSIRSKVKKRLRTVKRGILKEQLEDKTSKMGTRRTAIQSKLAEAATGHLDPGKLHARPRPATAAVCPCHPSARPRQGEEKLVQVG